MSIGEVVQDEAERPDVDRLRAAAHRVPRLAAPVMAVTGLLQTLPSLALLIPFMLVVIAMGMVFYERFAKLKPLANEARTRGWEQRRLALACAGCGAELPPAA